METCDGYHSIRIVGHSQPSEVTQRGVADWRNLIAADEAPLDVEGINERFRRYFAEARRLHRARAGVIDIYVGFETEAFSGYRETVAAAIETFRPDMILGSVHHVGDVPFDYCAEDYRRAVERAGGIEAFYCAYFDRQLELIDAFRPAVVGHFDIARVLDPTTANAGRCPPSATVPTGISRDRGAGSRARLQRPRTAEGPTRTQRVGTMGRRRRQAPL